MRNESGLRTRYFDWMMTKIRASANYKELIDYLYRTPFEATMFEDNNRVAAGLDLVYQFAYENNIDYTEIDSYFSNLRECSILEMMIALAMKMENQFLGGLSSEDQTWKWFWQMIKNLGLDIYDNRHFDGYEIDCILATFIDRKYSSDGQGGLFHIRNCKYDLRQVEIYNQMCWYSNSILERTLYWKGK